MIDEISGWEAYNFTEFDFRSSLDVMIKSVEYYIAYPYFWIQIAFPAV